MGDGWLIVVKGVVRKYVKCSGYSKGDCSQASRYTASGKCGLAYVFSSSERNSVIKSVIEYSMAFNTVTRA